MRRFTGNPGHFFIMYTITDTGDADHVEDLDSNANRVADRIDALAKALEDSYAFFVSELGYPDVAATSRIRVNVMDPGGNLDGRAMPMPSGPGEMTIRANADLGKTTDYTAPHELFHVIQYDYRSAWDDVLGPDVGDLLNLANEGDRHSWYEATAQWANHQFTKFMRASGHGGFDPDDNWKGDLGTYFGSSHLDVMSESPPPLNENRQYAVSILAEYLDEAFPEAQHPGFDPVKRSLELLAARQGPKEAIRNLVLEKAPSFSAFLKDYAQVSYQMSFSDQDLADWKAALADYSKPGGRHPDPQDPYYTGSDAHGDDRPSRTLAPFVAGTATGEVDLGELGMEYFDLDPQLNGVSGLLTVRVQRQDDNVEVRLVGYRLINPADGTQGTVQCDVPKNPEFSNGEAVATIDLSSTCTFATLVLVRTGKSDQAFWENSLVRFTASVGPGLISNGTVQLGVKASGVLIAPGGVPSTGTHDPGVGLRLVSSGYDGISPDCDCEGWGVSNGTVSGYAYGSGSTNLSVQPITRTSDSARSEVTAAGTFLVVHDYAPVVGQPYLYRIAVSVTDLTGGSQSLRYRRVMDWDVEPTAFAEYVTIGSFGSPPASLMYTDNNGFRSSNPLVAPAPLGATGYFTDFGPMDQGALFDLNFGTLGPNATKTFELFYGAAPNETVALSALQAVGAQAYSLGQPSNPGGPSFGQPITFFFGIKD